MASMLLHRIHPSRIAEIWLSVKAGLAEALLVPETILLEILANKIDLFYRMDEPKTWFYASYLSMEIDPRFRVMYVMAGWTEGKLSRKDCEGFIENLNDLAVATRCRNVLYSDKSQFLMRMLNGRPVWQTVR